MDLSQHTNPNFDLTLLDEIADGSAEFMAETIGLFLTQSPELISEIGQGIQEQNWDTVGAAAHKFKSTLGMFGMNASLELMQQIEKAAKQRVNPESLPEVFSRAKQLIESTYPDLEKISKGLSA